MNARNLWSNILIVAGGIGMVVGAIDPMEGSLLILPGSGLLRLGTYLGQAERRMLVYKVWAFFLIAIGVGALWGLSRGRRLWRLLWTFNVVGCADSAFPDWLEHGDLGAGFPTLAVVAGHGQWPMVSDVGGTHPETKGPSTLSNLV